MTGTATVFTVGFHCCHWTHVPALGTPNADSTTLAHLVGFGLLDEEVHALSGPADVGPRVETLVPDSKFADPQETIEAKGQGCP